MLKQIFKNKLLLAALLNFLVLMLVVVILSMSTQKSDKSGEADSDSSAGAGLESVKGKEDSDSAISGGLEIVQEKNDEATTEDSVTAPSTWSEPEKEASGEDGSNNQPSTDDKNAEKQEQQGTVGIPEDEAYEDKVPFGRIF